MIGAHRNNLIGSALLLVLVGGGYLLINWLASPGTDQRLIDRAESIRATLHEEAKIVLQGKPDERQKRGLAKFNDLLAERIKNPDRVAASRRFVEQTEGMHIGTLGD